MSVPFLEDTLCPASCPEHGARFTNVLPVPWTVVIHTKTFSQLSEVQGELLRDAAPTSMTATGVPASCFVEGPAAKPMRTPP